MAEWQDLKDSLKVCVEKIAQFRYDDNQLATMVLEQQELTQRLVVSKIKLANCQSDFDVSTFCAL